MRMELLLKRLAWTDKLSPVEQDQIGKSVSRVQSFAPGETIVPAEVQVDFSSVITPWNKLPPKSAFERCETDHRLSSGWRFL